MKQLWKIGIVVVAVLAIASAATGIVVAQTEGEAASHKDDFVAKLAENLGITQEELEAAIRETQLELLDEAVADGRITEEQAAEIRERIESGEAPLFPKHRPQHCRGAGVAREAAEFLATTPEEVLAGLQSGQSLAQIAEANGKTAEELAAFLLDELEEYLAQAVANGRSTQERADEILASAPEKIDKLINHEGPVRCVPRHRGMAPAPEEGVPMEGGRL